MTRIAIIDIGEMDITGFDNLESVNLKSDNFAKRGDENDNNVISEDYFAENEEDDEDSEYNIFEILIAEDYFWTMTTAIMKTGRKVRGSLMIP